LTIHCPSTQRSRKENERKPDSMELHAQTWSKHKILGTVPCFGRNWQGSTRIAMSTVPSFSSFTFRHERRSRSCGWNFTDLLLMVQIENGAMQIYHYYLKLMAAAVSSARCASPQTAKEAYLHHFLRMTLCAILHVHTTAMT